MTRRSLAATLFGVCVLALAAAPAFAGNYIGYDVDYVLNPNGREVRQALAPDPYAFGVDVWYVPGTVAWYADPAARSTSMIEAWREQAFIAEAPGHAFGLRDLGHQADA